MISINLTTTFSRQSLCAQTVFSLIQQSTLPDKIVIWVSNEPYLRDAGIQSEPKWIKELNKIHNIIEIKWTKNIGPYRKLIPALQSASEGDIIITADDDIIYGKHWLKHLVNCSAEHPNKIIAARVRKITHNTLRKRTSYTCWPIITEKQTIASEFIVTHGGGALFRKELLKPELIKNEEYLNICPTTDDLWFSKIILESAIPIFVCPLALDELNFIDHRDGLDNVNTLKPQKMLSKIYKNLILYPLGWLGISICGNDKSFKKIESHKFH